MFFTGIVTTIGSVIVKLSWAAIKPAIVAALSSLTIGLTVSTAATIVGLVIAGAVALTVAAYDISFFHAVYMAQQKGTGVDISFKWFRFKETYR